MNQPTVLTEQRGRVGLIILNRPVVLNAWDKPMRSLLLAALERFENDPGVGAIVLTGAGERAFSAGQDLNETKSFDADGGETWIGEWERLYGRIRSLSKPLVVALNGVAAGSAFQLSLLADIRIGHAGVTMGQPEINSGIASSLGPWIMREILGLARTIELTLTGRMMKADECLRIGVITRIVAPEAVLDEALAVAGELAGKPPVAMRLNKKRFREVTEPGFRDALDAGVLIQRESYGSGEPSRMMEQFLQVRAARKANR
jgi:enoyl-CoA hydratase/carnithine racemase